MKTKNKKKKHRPTKTDRPPTRAKWLSLVGLISALFVGAWLWMRRQTDQTAATTAQNVTDTTTDPADSIIYTAAPPTGPQQFDGTQFSGEFA